MRKYWQNAKKEPFSTAIGTIVLVLVTFKFTLCYLSGEITAVGHWTEYVIGWIIGGGLIGSNIGSLLNKARGQSENQPKAE